jgi:hypothetical protein
MAATAEPTARAAQDAPVLTDKSPRWMVAIAVMASAMMELVDTSASDPTAA